jgi:N-acetylglucosamine kinase-like BadF-type ATPase
MTRAAPASGPVPAILAVDGGNSKTDLALVATDGTLLAALRGPTVSHQAVGLEAGMAALDALVGAALAEAGRAADVRPAARLAVLALAGADLPADVRALRRAAGQLRLADEIVILNDTQAGLRAGSDRGWGVAVVCGAGINAVGVGPTGRVVRYAGLGGISGDRGGGGWVGAEGLAAAIRGRDGRGPRTVLERLVPASLGFRRPADVTRALYDGRLDEDRLADLAPVVFEAAADGDAVAAGIVDALADEVVAWAVATIRRLRLARRGVPVVLAGGVFRAAYTPFVDRIRAGIHAVAPSAVIGTLGAPPVVGSALIGLDRTTDDPGRRRVAEARLRATLTFERLGPG